MAASIRRVLKRKRDWALFVLVLVVLAVIVALVTSFLIRDSDDDGKWYSGRNLHIKIAGTERLEEAVSLTPASKYIVLRPRQLDNELAAVFLTIANVRSGKTLLSIDKFAAFIFDQEGRKFPLINPLEGEEVSAPDPDLDRRYSPYIWGNIDLPKGYMQSGWVFFEVPKGTKLSYILWEEADSFRVYLTD